MDWFQLIDAIDMFYFHYFSNWCSNEWADVWMKDLQNKSMIKIAVNNPIFKNNKKGTNMKTAGFSVFSNSYWFPQADSGFGSGYKISKDFLL